MEYYVYILRTSKNTLYTGITNNLEKRLQAHKSKKGSKYTRVFDSVELVYQEKCPTKSDALKREYAIKQFSKSQKEQLISLGVL